MSPYKKNFKPGEYTSGKEVDEIIVAWLHQYVNAEGLRKRLEGRARTPPPWEGGEWNTTWVAVREYHMQCKTILDIVNGAFGPAGVEQFRKDVERFVT